MIKFLLNYLVIIIIVNLNYFNKCVFKKIRIVVLSKKNNYYMFFLEKKYIFVIEI